MAQIEDIANDIVLQNSKVETRLMGVEEAKESGARALFGEKYGDEVRVVSMGDPTGNAVGWSVELCGGTHVNRTGDIGLITVLGEAGVSSGVRRIEALTAKGARHHARTNTNLVASAADVLRTTPAEILNRIEALQDNLKKSERSLSEAQKKLALGGSSGAAAAPAAEIVNGIAFVGRTVEGVAAKDLRGLVDVEKKKIGSGVVALVLKGEDGKGTVADRRHRRSRRQTTRPPISSSSRRSRWAGRVVAAVPTWRRAADRMARRPTTRSPRCAQRRWLRSSPREPRRSGLRAAYPAPCAPAPLRAASTARHPPAHCARRCAASHRRSAR